jgi:hypothetical protein
MTNANLLAILVAALVGFLIGGLWYGPLFGKMWMREHSFTDAQIQDTNLIKVYGLAFAFSGLSAVFLGHLLASVQASAKVTMMIAPGIAIGFIAPAIGTTYLFSRKSGTLFAIDAGYWIIAYAAMGAVFVALGV